MKTIFKQSLKTLLIIAGLFGIVALVSAWTAPTLAPPGGNVPAPVNVGAVTQLKSGALGVSGTFTANSRALFGEKVGIGPKFNVASPPAPSQQLEVDGKGIFNDSVGIGGPPLSEAQMSVFGQINAYRLKITQGSPGANKVLTSDANGLASWQTPSGGGINPVYTGDWSTGTHNLGNYTFCALTNMYTKDYLGNNPNYSYVKFRCKVYKEGSIWKMDVVLDATYIESDEITCGATCF